MQCTAVIQTYILTCADVIVHSTCMSMLSCTCTHVHCKFFYMKIHVPSMLAIGVDKHTQQTNKQPQWLH